jgi:hypothetical protein
MAKKNVQDADELHAVFETFGVLDQATRALMIGRKGLVINLASLGKLQSDNDITEMAKKMAHRTQADGRVHLGIVIVKYLHQTLIWWVHDRQNKRGLVLHAADFDADTLAKAAMRMKNIRKERADKEPSVTVLGKFDPDDFDTHEGAFLNLMLQTFGVLKETLTLHSTSGNDADYIWQ